VDGEGRVIGVMMCHEGEWIWTHLECDGRGGSKGVPSLDLEGVGPAARNGLDEGDGDGKEGKGVE